MSPKVTEDNFSDVITDIIEKYWNEPEKCFSKIGELKYPGTDVKISYEHAKCYYQVYAKHMVKLDLDKDFDKKAYAKNKKIYDNAHK